MNGQLFLPGWEQEPCLDADEQAFTDLHARPRTIPGDHGRPASRGTYSRLRRIHTIKPKARYL